MKKIITYLITFIMIWVNVTYAETSFKYAPKLISSTDNSINITWDKIDSASWYYVYYSETSGKDYKTFWDVFEENKTTITWLKPSTTYYVAVTYLDKATNDESVFSPEWVFNTKVWNEEKFALEEINVINAANLEVTFNSAIDQNEDAIREFKIVQNNREVVSVKETKINKDDDKKINLVLENSLEKWEYKLTVIYMTDKLGRNIEEWINWELKFIVNDNHLNVEIDSEVELTQENIELNAGTPEESNSEYYWLAWKAMTWVLSTWEDIAAKSNKLPKTWPESVFLVLVSFILGLVYLRKRRTV